MKKAGYDVAQIAAKIGRSEKYVYDRVKLLQLVPEVKKIFLDGEITAGHAILLARLTPKDQARAIGEDLYQSGLFQAEIADVYPALELEDDRGRKPRSVREFETWINDNVRFKPNEVDLPNLFPETAAKLATAREEELKVVKITRDYRVLDEARDAKERTYGSASWKRADGGPDFDWTGKERRSKPCDYAVVGVVVAGPGRGEAFHVCVEKKKCKLHWAQEQREAARRAKEQGAAGSGASRASTYAEQQKRWEEQRRRKEAETARWKKAAPKIIEALVEKLKLAPAGATSAAAAVVVKACEPNYGRTPPQDMERGRTAEDIVRYCAYLVLYQYVMNAYAPVEASKRLKAFGIDAKKILDEVAPKPKPEPEENGKPAEKAKRPARRS